MESLSASGTPNGWQCHPTDFTIAIRIAASETTPPAKADRRGTADGAASGVGWIGRSSGAYL